MCTLHDVVEEAPEAHTALAQNHVPNAGECSGPREGVHATNNDPVVPVDARAPCEKWRATISTPRWTTVRQRRVAHGPFTQQGAQRHHEPVPGLFGREHLVVDCDFIHFATNSSTIAALAAGMNPDALMHLRGLWTVYSDRFFKANMCAMYLVGIATDCQLS